MYKKAASSGDDKATFLLGKLYYSGKYVKRDLEKALYYFSILSDYGDQKAAYNIAIIYANKRYKNHNYEKAFEIFSELAKKGYGKAQNKVGIMLLHGLGVDKDYKISFEWFEEAYFKSNYKPASCNLAIMFVNGYGVFPNFGRAAKLAQIGLKENIPSCVKVYKEFKLHKYKEDKGFKSGYYKDF